MHQEDTTTINIYAPDQRAPKYTEQKLIDKEEK